MGLFSRYTPEEKEQIRRAKVKAEIERRKIMIEDKIKRIAESAKQKPGEKLKTGTKRLAKVLAKASKKTGNVVRAGSAQFDVPRYVKRVTIGSKYKPKKKKSVTKSKSRKSRKKSKSGRSSLKRRKVIEDFF